MSWIILGAFAFFAILLIFWAIGIYNRLVVLRNQFTNSFAQVEVQLKRRYDLIPNLVEMVKGIMGHEKDFFTEVVEKRNQAVARLQSCADNPGDPQAMQQLVGAESALGGALGRLFALSEDYPEMKTHKNMLQLQEDLRTTENKVAFARQAYNDSVTTYNTYKQTFPPVLFAGTFGHARDAALLDFDDNEINEAPKVSF
ncbi:MAG: LemA family protein [Planctomycetes bacterium]|nr:LemA family protein [Planctomycetota bacterium]